jgi:vitamin B12 transporter
MRRLNALAVLVSLAVSFPTSAAAGQGALAGSARTTEGTPLPQVVLVIQGPAGAQRVVTGPDGQYRVTPLAPGEYRVSPRTPGLVLQQEARTTVGDGEARLDIVLAPAPVREHVVVAATRGDAPLSTVGVSATVLEGDAIAAREPSDFVHLLQDVPGVAVARAGGVGLQSGVFVRGGASNFARVLVDGVPVNEPGGAFNFGSQLPLELDRVEVVRGATSSLYGTDALAGVVQLVTRQADALAKPSVRAEAEGGSFAWRRFQGGSTGRAGAFDWNAGVVRLDTDNQEPNSDFGETAGAASLGVRLSDRSTLRFVFRGEDAKVGTPGPTAFGRPDLDARFDSSSLVVGSEWRFAGANVANQARLGFAKTNQLSRNPEDSGTYTPAFEGTIGAYPISDFPNPDGFQNDVRRLSAGYQAEIRAGSANLVTAGADLEHETGEVGSLPADILSPSRTNVGAYVQDRLVVDGRVFLTLGGRLEHNDGFGTKAVPRVAVAWRIASGENTTILRASAGAGIKEPDFFQSFGLSFFAQGNPALRPERSRTYDVGLEQRLAGDRVRAQATFFTNDYRDQIAYHLVDPNTFQGTYINLGKTRARGVELALEASPARHLRLGASYTFLDGEVLVSTSDFDPVYAVGQPLLRRPKHQASAWGRVDAGRFTFGANLVSVGRRADSDFVGLGLTENAAYTRVGARTQLRLGRGVEAFVVAENLFDAHYQEVLGYPALGRAVRGGLRLRSGAGR